MASGTSRAMRSRHKDAMASGTSRAMRSRPLPAEHGAVSSAGAPICYHRAMPPPRRFPPPWSIEEGAACFIVTSSIFRPDNLFCPHASESKIAMSRSGL